jgi:hypothetical protein
MSLQAHAERWRVSKADASVDSVAVPGSAGQGPPYACAVNTASCAAKARWNAGRASPRAR